MRSTVLRSVLAVSTIGVGSLLTACGGDDGASGGKSDAVSIEEFCTKIDGLATAEPDDIGAAVAAIQGLVVSAPTDEVRDALEILIPVLARLSAIDENDPDAIGEMMELALDPKIMEASAVLETFGAEECGFTSE